MLLFDRYLVCHNEAITQFTVDKICYGFHFVFDDTVLCTVKQVAHVFIGFLLVFIHLSLPFLSLHQSTFLVVTALYICMLKCK